MGGCHLEGDSAWWLLQLAVEKPWSVPGGPFVCFFEQMEPRKCSFHLVGTPFLAFSPTTSVEQGFPTTGVSCPVSNYPPTSLCPTY